MASSAVADSFTSQAETKKQKQLQEARAAGTAAPETDATTGKMINPHNPQFITQAPWYLMQNKPSLRHQQAWNMQAAGTKDWYKRGTKGDVKTKFIKGACENCGATTHSKKDCVERPRQVAAKVNGKNLMPDEYIENLALDYDGKRDRWNGFQPDDYKLVIDEWDKAEAERRKVKAMEMEERAKIKERLKEQKKALKKKRKQRRKQLRRQAEGRDTDGEDSDTGDSDTGETDTDSDTDSDSDASDDEDLGEKMKDFDKTSATVATKDDKLRTTTRNLRIREDTAKYLLNLDVNSAFYDPKSRSMRQDPLAHLKDEEKGLFRGDNFVRQAGDAKQLTELMLFAWDAYRNGEKIHDTAQPTQALKMWNVYKQRSKDLEVEKAKELIDKYGGEEHLNGPKEVLFAQNETYVEYTRDGRILKGRERAYVQSKYVEDVVPGNHHSIWGSWYDSTSNQWGFACCHQTLKNAYCIALKKHDAVEEAPDGAESEAEKEAEGGGSSSSDSDDSSSSSGDKTPGEGDANDAEAEKKKERLAEKRKARALAGLKLAGKAAEGEAAASSAGAASSSTAAAGEESRLANRTSSGFGHVLEDATDLNQKKIDEAVEREKKRRKTEKQGNSIEDERKRGYNSASMRGQSTEVSPEEFEAYRLERQRGDDPMAKFL